MSVTPVSLEGMERSSDLLLLRAVQAWCDECDSEQLLVPVSEDGAPGGLCCTVCDAAVFVMPVLVEEASLRRSA
jgi:hypothetical protein